ncbi:MAG: SCP2 sterol-binding domain-containing protein [Lachnospiraceae bacterium]|nr:SCP2 sterol-binding domain-containing protein [Lachnospiraceae bacterium]
MNVNIYYGGRGLIDDPVLHVINKMQEVMEELRVNVTRYNLHEMKNSIATLPQTLKEADGVILATTVEWIGIGGYMQLFLDACWFYGDKTKISNIYMLPVVMSTTYGEREANLTLLNAWEMLGGKSCRGVYAYVEDVAAFEMNKDYNLIIEKNAEDLYRSISQNAKMLPTSNMAIKQNILKNKVNYTPQESEQLSKYASDDIYVKKQKEDIEELADIYKSLLGNKKENELEEYVEQLKSAFVPQKDLKAIYLLDITDKSESIVIEVDNAKLNCYATINGDAVSADITAKLSYATLESILRGSVSFQRTFMTGEMTAKGDFGTLRMLDTMFKFKVR